MLCMPPPQLVALSGCLESLGAILADRLEQPVPGRLAALVDSDERCLDQALHVVERCVGRIDRADALDGIEPESAREHRQLREQPLAGRVEEVVAPVHGLAERPVAGRPEPSPGHEEAEAIAESLADLRRGEDAGTCGRELDRQRDALEVGTDLADRGDRAIVVGQACARRPGPGNEQADRLGIASARIALHGD
jgi:hypothetical protein